MEVRPEEIPLDTTATPPTSTVQRPALARKGQCGERGPEGRGERMPTAPPPSETTRGRNTTRAARPTETLLRSKCGVNRRVLLRPACRDTRSSEAAQPRTSHPGQCNCQHCKDHRKGDACEGGLGCVTARARPNQVPNTAKININADQPTEVRPEEVFPWTQLPQQRQ